MHSDAIHSNMAMMYVSTADVEMMTTEQHFDHEAFNSYLIESAGEKLVVPDSSNDGIIGRTGISSAVEGIDGNGVATTTRATSPLNDSFVLRYLTHGPGELARDREAEDRSGESDGSEQGNIDDGEGGENMVRFVEAIAGIVKGAEKSRRNDSIC